jgi:hypothetical protein
MSAEIEGLGPILLDEVMSVVPHSRPEATHLETIAITALMIVVHH